MNSNRDLVIVGIDFGTAYSGYYYADTMDDPERPQIHANNTWPGAIEKAKTLTELLLLRDHTFVAFGHAAQRKYAIATPQERDNYLHFSNFKMTLHDQEGARRSIVRASNCDQTIPTKKLISICLRFLKDKALEQIQSTHIEEVLVHQIQWVITVPAIWDIPARLAMKHAAEEADIPPDNILIALEPEAAFLHCLQKYRIQLGDSCDFMAVDAGGGTVDITVNRKSKNDLIELRPPSGGPWGSTVINKKFEQLVVELFGDINRGPDWHDVMREFEIAKTGYSPDYPVGIVKVQAIYPKNVDTLLNNITQYNTQHGTNVVLDQGRRILQLNSFLEQQFKQLATAITSHISNLLAEPGLEQVKYVFLVGGFAGCNALQNSVKELLTTRNTNQRMLITESPEVAVLKGAVLFGFNPLVIKSRVAFLSIGVALYETWDDTKHFGREKYITDEGKVMCEFVECIVHAGETVPVSHKFVGETFPVDKRGNDPGLFVWASKKPNISFTSDEGTWFLGVVPLIIPATGSRKLKYEVRFGGTVVEAKLTHVRSGETADGRFDFDLDGRMDSAFIPVLR